jgi:3-deoxy-D-manno-octulosonic-acid transferase
MGGFPVKVYNILLACYRFGISIGSIFLWKAALWTAGRKDLEEEIKDFEKMSGGPTIWMHCASLGEFEQGRPILEALRAKYPEARILLTFFSPSGYEVRKSYAKASKVLYLPLDHPEQSIEFVKRIQPELAVFIRYEFWYHYLHSLYQLKIPTILVSARFTSGSIFFKPWGKLHQEMLRFFDRIFVQDKESKDLLASIGIEHVSIAGDSRFDRVLAIARIAPELSIVNEFKQSRKLLVAGSTWEADEVLLNKSMEFIDQQGIALVIAPHDIHSFRLSFIEKKFADYGVCRYSTWNERPKDIKYRVLLVDNIGKLSAIYRYANLSYIGGGFNKSVHNVLEAAVYGMPVFFGPKYKHIAEAVDLKEADGAFPVKDKESLERAIRQALSEEAYEHISKANAEYVRSGAGATSHVMEYLEMIGF